MTPNDETTGSTSLPNFSTDRNISRHESQDWYHPEFKSARDARFAMINRTSQEEGTFMITNVPEEEKAYRLYGNGNYLILRGGTRSGDVTFYIINKKENDEGFVLCSINLEVLCHQVFPSIYDLVEFFQQKTLPGTNSTLAKSLKTCKIQINKRCRKCRSEEDS